jgi:cytochrome P450
MATNTLPAALPGPSKPWLLGWRGLLISLARDTIGYIGRMQREHGNLFALTRGGIALNNSIANFPGTIVAIGPEYNQLVLGHPDRFHNALQLGVDGTPWQRIGAGLLNMNGEKHKQQRRMIMPAMQRSRVEMYHDDMVAITREVLNRWQPGERRDVSKDMRLIALRIAAQALFGFDVAGEAERLGGLIDAWIRQNASFWLLIIPMRWSFLPWGRYLRLSAELDTAISQLVQRLRAEPNRSIVSYLVHARDEDGSRMTEDELIGQANLLFVAGHETTANALTWTLFLLSQHPHILADLHDELSGVLHGQPPTTEQLCELPLLERVIKESLRILPPVPFGARTCVEETELGPYTLPANTEILFSEYLTHRLPELYPEPERFLPSRWETFEPSAYEYIPFSAGSRMCVGATFAMQEIKIVLAMLLQDWRLELAPGAVIDRYVGMTISSKYGMPMVVGRQDRRFERMQPGFRGTVREMVAV